MLIRCYPDDFIIKNTRESIFHGQNSIDFSIKAIKIKNTTDQLIKLTTLTYKLTEKGQLVQEIIYNEWALQQKVKSFSNFAKKLLKRRKGFGEGLRVGNLQKAFGSESIWDERHLNFSTSINPGREVGIIAEHIVVFTPVDIDEVTIQLRYYFKQKLESIELHIPLKHYRVKNEFIFPVKGKWHVIGAFDDYVNGHRAMHSQEYAFDLDKLYESDPLPRSDNNSKYPCYGENVYAIGPGEVMQVCSEIPENQTGGSDLEISEIEKLWEKFGFEPLGPGNYVSIKHPNNEYSFYAHMIPSSIAVSQGDIVEPGQLLGRVGNSGNSDGPHLHFQLMDGPSTQTGRGLPCLFTNLMDCYGNKIDSLSNATPIIIAL